jgi:hypothetical protein
MIAEPPIFHAFSVVRRGLDSSGATKISLLRGGRPFPVFPMANGIFLAKPLEESENIFNFSYQTFSI